MSEYTTIYRVLVFRSYGEPLGSRWIEEYFDSAEAEAVRDRLNAQNGIYARIEERPYTPVERKSNFFGPPVRHDLPPLYIGRHPPRDFADRRYGEHE